MCIGGITSMLPLFSGLVQANSLKKAGSQEIDTSQIAQPIIDTYTPQAGSSPAYEAPEAPIAAPIMTTAGQGEAEDELKANDQRVKRAKKGRNALRIDRTQPGSGGLAGGSGVNVPQ